MKRRTILTGGGALAAMLATGRAPAIAQPAGSRAIRFVPQTNLTVLDPVIGSTTISTRDHACMIYDTLYGLDEHYAIRPQMAEGHETSADGLTWRIRLRDGLRFHDREPVRAQDCLASLTRWGRRDVLGQTWLAALNESRAADDRTMEFRLKRPFPHFLEVLGKSAAPIPFMMPERLARTDPFTSIKDFTGSGPFRFVTAEFQPDVATVYERFAEYVPRNEPPSWFAGGKMVKTERIEWKMITDVGTAVAGLQAGELDWIDDMDPDLIPVVERSANARMLIRNPVGLFQIMRLNHLHPPFDDPAVRRAILLGIDQREYAQAVMGTDPRLSADCRSIFTCATPFASELGTAPLRTQSVAKAAAALKAAGYAGQKVVILQATDLPNNRAVASVTADLFGRMGLSVELASSDWATVAARRMRKDPGAWSVYFAAAAGTDLMDPLVSANLRTNGAAGQFGWPDDKRIEALRDQWLDTIDPTVERQIADQIQRYAFETVPFVPLFRLFRPSGVAKSLKGILLSPAVSFWGVEKA